MESNKYDQEEKNREKPDRWPDGVVFRYGDRRRFSSIVKDSKTSFNPSSHSKPKYKLKPQPTPQEYTTPRTQNFRAQEKKFEPLSYKSNKKGATSQISSTKKELHLFHQYEKSINTLDDRYINFDILIDVNDLESVCIECGGKFWGPENTDIIRTPIIAGIRSESGLTNGFFRFIASCIAASGIALILCLLLYTLKKPISHKWFYIIQVLVGYHFFNILSRQEIKTMNIDFVICKQCNKKNILVTDGSSAFCVEYYIYDPQFYFTDKAIRPKSPFFSTKRHRNNINRVSELNKFPISISREGIENFHIDD